jgi:hypothetical protein
MYQARDRTSAILKPCMAKLQFLSTRMLLQELKRALSRILSNNFEVSLPFRKGLLFGSKKSYRALCYSYS